MKSRFSVTCKLRAERRAPRRCWRTSGPKRRARLSKKTSKPCSNFNNLSRRKAGVSLRVQPDTVENFYCEAPMPIISPTTAADQAIWAARQNVRLATAGDAQSAVATAQASSGDARQKKMKDVGQQFEALYLRQMLEEWMPKDSEALFGEGTAGSVWRSMLADHMATTLSKSGTIGIAQMIMKHEPDGSKGK
jgi:flagellar protein FlgJ